MSADRGKYAEGRVRIWLQRHKGDRLSFTFNRILDARAARGAMSNPQPGDFQWFLDTGIKLHPYGVPDGAYASDHEHPYTRNGLIEVKEVAHTHLLPYKNFSVDQVGRMRIRAMAGSEVLVLVCFRPQGEKPYWRSAPLEFFENRDLSRGSWDMSGIDAYDCCDDLLEMHLK